MPGVECHLVSPVPIGRISALAQILWQAPSMTPAVVALLAVMLAAVLLLYPPQTRNLRRGWRWTLIALRGATIVALAVSMVQPAVLRPRTAAQQGAIVVLADRSRSMSVSDRGRSTAQLMSLAAGLGALPPDVRAEAVPGLRAQLDQVRSAIDLAARARSEAEYAQISGRGAGAAEARLRDAADQLHEAIGRIAVPPATPTGVPELAALVAKLKRPLPPVPDDASLKALRNDVDAAMQSASTAQARADEMLFENNAAVRTACVRLGRSSRQNLMDRALTDPHAGLLANLPAGAPVVGFSFAEELLPIRLGAGEPLDFPPDGARSDIAGAIHDAMRRMHGRDVQAVVVLSDGRQVTDPGSGAGSADLSALGVPVFAVPMASSPSSSSPPHDVSITAMDLPNAARVGETITVRARITATGYAKQPLDVRLDAGESISERRVTVGDDETVAAEFEVKLEQAGAQELAVTAMPLAGEVSDENNLARRWVRVGDAPLRVTVIAGADAGKQYASLHDALSRAPWVSLREVEEGQTSRLTAATMLSQDVVVLCDLPPDALSRSQWDSLDVLVRRRGGSVILCAGAHLPAAYAAVAAQADWLPYDPANGAASWRAWPGGQPHFRVVPQGGTSNEMADEWQHLAPVSRLVTIDRPRPGVRAMLVERDSGAAVVTDANLGAGRVIFIGTDEAWRWQGQAGAGERTRFWTALARLAARLPYPANEGNLWLDASNVSPEPYQSITVRARVLLTDGTPSDAPTQVVRLMQGQDQVAQATLRSEGTGDGRYAGSLQAPAGEGDYTLRLEAPPEPAMEIPPAPVTLPLHVAVNTEPEMADLSGDERTLRRMAQSSGGRVVPLDQLPALARMLAQDRERQNTLAEYPLWDSPYLFVFVLACLSTEWSLRKKFGLA